METLLKEIVARLTDRDNESLKLSMNHVHAEGLFSLVVDGSEFGKLTRIFIADKKLKPFTVQYHTHRYPIKLTAVRGSINHHTAEVNTEESNIKISQFNYCSFLNGGEGLTYDKEILIGCRDYKIPIGSQISLDVEDYHTVSCS